jgi:hypothetical protein
MCECCTGPCQEAEIKCTPGSGMDYAMAPISLKKTWSGCQKECYSAADEYEFDVPDFWNSGQWAKFLAAMMFYDMLFFEQMFQCWFIAPICCKMYTC